MANMFKSKYNSSGERCADACLSYGELRYVKEDGSPIKIEIPCDKYDETLNDFFERIKEGIAQTVIDPRKVLVRGSVTYEQAKLIAIQGKIKGLNLFQIDESIECEHLLGISGSIEYALSIWNGDKKEDALKKAVIRAIKIYGEDFIKEVELEEDKDPEEYKNLCNAIYTATSKANVSQLFSPKNIHIDEEFYDEDLSTKQKLMKNVSLSLGIFGAVLGFSLVQIATNFGKYISNTNIYIAINIIVIILFSFVFMKISKLISNKYIKKSSESIMDMFNEELDKITEDNLLADKESKIILKNITKGEVAKLLVNMKGSVNKRLSCNTVVAKETKYVLDLRRTIVLPNEFEIKQTLDKFLHIYKEKLNKDTKDAKSGKRSILSKENKENDIDVNDELNQALEENDANSSEKNV